MASSLRLLLLSQDYPPAVGGIQTYAHAIAERLYRDCQSFAVMAPQQSGADTFDGAQPFSTVRVSGGSNWMRLSVLPQLLKEVRARGLRTVFTGHWYVAAAALAARRMGAIDHVFVAAHGQEILKSLVPGPLTPLYTHHRRSVLEQVDGVFPVSRYTAQLVREQGVAESRCIVVGNGTDLARFDVAKASEDARRVRARLGIGEAPTLVTVCRLVQRKGIDTVIESLNRLRTRLPNVHYVIAGAGPDEARLKALAIERGLAERTHFLGKVDNDDLPGIYRAGDVFVMPARRDGSSVEGFGLSFCEAGACERPVIGTYCGGIPDAVVDGETGRLVPPDSAIALAGAIEELLGAPDLASDMGIAGRKRIATQGTWDHTVSALIEGMQRLSQTRR